MLILSLVALFFAVFIMQILAISIGVVLMRVFQKLISTLLVTGAGVAIPYLSFKIVSILFNLTQYRWYHFVVISSLIGMMNNGNLKGESTEEGQWITTFLFSGTVIMSIIMFWLD